MLRRYQFSVKLIGGKAFRYNLNAKSRFVAFNQLMVQMDSFMDQSEINLIKSIDIISAVPAYPKEG
jgi:hypothetical protein